MESEDQQTAERKFRAKRTNEQVKLTASLVNTLAAAVIATAVIVPTIRAEREPNLLDRRGWVLIGLAIHGFGLAVLRLGTRREE